MKKLVLCCALASALFTSDAATKAVVRTSFGEIELELDEAKAPVTVANFVEYAKSGFYDGTIFHRVIDGFMIQGGGFTKEMRQKATRPPIKNEAGNGLGNRKYTIAMARTQVVDSATAQFFINVRDNGFLDHRSEDMAGFGYAVFGTVTKGTDVVDRIARVKTGQVAYFSDVPVEPVVIEKVTVGEKAASADGPAPDYAAYVNPFIGTSGTGHTTPAACAPFGLVQAGPDTGRSGWAYCGGYLWGDKTICGFSQTHINGTGVIELGDLPILPFRGEKPEPQVHDKATETASPGYYAVTFADAKIRTEITARPHTAFYRITYRGDGPRRLLVDCRSVLGGRNHRAAVTPGADGRGLSGTIERRGWVARTYSFAMTFDRPCAKMAELPRGPGERTPRYVFDFDLKPDEALEVRVALSAEGDEAAARRNLEAEAKGVTFDAARALTRADWNALFARAAAEGDEAAKTNFYTSLYHLFVQPNNIADAGAKPFYSTFSCWDSFRSAHPLYTILSPERVPGFVDSMLVQGRRTGFLPVWALWGRDNQCMVGTHSIPVIVDAFFKGLFPEGADPKAVFEQVKETLTKRHPNRNKENWDLLDTYGYYPFDKIRGESVSRTLECVYDDWCAAQFAAKLGRKEDEAFFLRRSGYWKNVFDPKIGFVRGKDTKGNWREPFSPFKLGHGPGTANDFTEGNAFHYTWHVMQDPEGLVAAMGGREAFVRKLDELFSAPEKVAGAGSVLDVTGLIGQYAHGNEPSHHVIYFYTLVGRQDRAAERVREIFDRFYLPKPDGLCGNDDCGAMSAWYVFSAMGFYPFNPCGGEYVLGAPQLPRVTLALPGGKRFAVVAQNLSAKNKYVKAVALNGRPLARPTLRHEEILAGGELVFTMADRP